MPSVQDATQWVGPMILFLLMTVVGLELTAADFRRVASSPRAVIGGTLAQIALLPLLTGVVVAGFGVSPALAAGAIIVAVAPSAGARFGAMRDHAAHDRGAGAAHVS